MTDTTDKARELVEMSEKAQHPFAGSLPRLRLAEAKLEHAVDLARAYLEQAELLEAARRERDEEREIVNRLWRILAGDPPPTYEQLGGRSIYDFATDAKTAVALARTLAGALEGLADEHAFICRQYERKPQQPWHAAHTALTAARAAGLLGETKHG